MRAGRLRHRIAIQSVTRTRTATGGYTEAWATDATVWGAIEPLRGREYFENQQVQGEATHRIVLRHRASVTTDQRLVHASRTFHPVQSINPSERDISLEIMAREQV